MIAGLAQRLDSLLAQWVELPDITARVAQQWDKELQHALPPESINSLKISNESDKAVFNKIREILPPNGIIRKLIPESGGFSPWDVDPDIFWDLKNFRCACAIETRIVFKDDDLEKSLQELLESIEEFLEQLAQNTLPNTVHTGGTIGWNAIPSEWKWKQPDRYDQAVIGLLKSSAQVWDKYQRLSRMAYRKLDIRVAQQWDKQMSEITAQVTPTRDKPIDWLQYRWWLIGAAGILLLLGLIWFAFQGGQSTVGDCSPIVDKTTGNVSLECNLGGSKPK